MLALEVKLVLEVVKAVPVEELVDEEEEQVDHKLLHHPQEDLMLLLVDPNPDLKDPLMDMQLQVEVSQHLVDMAPGEGMLEISTRRLLIAEKMKASCSLLIMVPMACLPR